MYRCGFLGTFVMAVAADLDQDGPYSLDLEACRLLLSSFRSG